eukprot:CAMPEP_0113637152 /NCGR_PEP_ID=MMETSP0017_2-20120614/19438_1 /TAXON_ID=2856 /ORGANISM="Cylindrotheca closterium" /LENGTH=418 /DNA_ID=CAMNT_0000548149 /DNA_START=20 /DNA_END=1273 /DNA_ORIENTATION=+ /assembly_acc=CAM_ASM_000147
MVNDYLFEGKEGETVPRRVRKLIVNPGIQVLPDRSFSFFVLLEEVTLPQGLTKIGNEAFRWCERLLEIKICSTVEYIGEDAFGECELLTKVEFESSSSSPHQLKTIGGSAFESCESLQRIKIPSSVNMIGECAFHNCYVLVEANLSTTSITEISGSFLFCRSLQTVSLPNSLERIGDGAFCECTSLVTVMVPLDSQPIEIAESAFYGCGALSNLVLPQGSNATEESIFAPRAFFAPCASFGKCALLQDRFGAGVNSVVAGLVGRFENFPVHKFCYGHSSTTAQELQRCIEDQEETEESLVDEFGMTPFHILFSSAEPSGELLQVLLDEFLYSVLGLKDANGKLAMDYLVTNWTRDNKMLLQMALQSWMFSRLTSWGATSWMEAMRSKVQDILAEDNKDRRSTLWMEAKTVFAQYEHVE